MNEKLLIAQNDKLFQRFLIITFGVPHTHEDPDGTIHQGLVFRNKFLVTRTIIPIKKPPPPDYSDLLI